MVIIIALNTLLAWVPQQVNFNPNPVVFPLLVILVEFEDKPAPIQQPKEYYETQLFSNDTSSLATYYQIQSNQKLIINGQVFGWITMPQSYHYYEDGYSGNGVYPKNAQRLAEHAILSIREMIRLADYDKLNANLEPIPDGVIDGVLVIHSGNEGSSSNNEIGSHEGMLNLEFNGILFNSYAMVSNQYSRGLYCHEFGHLLGLPDLYDSDYSSSGLGLWSMMSWGMEYGLDAWSKALFGWVNVRYLNPGDNQIAFNPVQFSHEVIKIQTPKMHTKEYFLLEHRARLGYDANLPAGGILLYHVDDRVATNSNESHPRVRIIELDGRNDLLSHNGNYDGDVYSAFGNSSRFLTSFTNPRLYSYDNQQTNIIIGHPMSGLDRVWIPDGSLKLALIKIIYTYDKTVWDIGDTVSFQLQVLPYGDWQPNRILASIKGNCNILQGVATIDVSNPTAIPTTTPFKVIITNNQTNIELHSTYGHEFDCTLISGRPIALLNSTSPLLITLYTADTTEYYTIPEKAELIINHELHINNGAVLKAQCKDHNPIIIYPTHNYPSRTASPQSTSDYDGYWWSGDYIASDTFNLSDFSGSKLRFIFVPINQASSASTIIDWRIDDIRLQSKNYITDIDGIYHVEYAINVWPNPFKAMLNIETTTNEPINVYSLAGELITILSNSGKQKSWQPSTNLAPGIYLVGLQSNTEFQKVIYLGH